ncbi:hydrogenase expression/formation protein HypE [Zooshikella sp. WH53]|uniref:Hydrogenase expression/formation protein HypE n=1 Tax=Zooshikella harenae TaxID=2827238 RepID=A0ABS5ZE11_9GAMM|nr:hydrogenase expression/formation protein HypE [Zooshikella harenae]
MLSQQIITLAHGAGGAAMQQLIDSLFLKAFNNGSLALKEDQARLPLAELQAKGDRLAFTTDSYVVSPLFFPGGDIGKLAVCGTLNDLAVGGAQPLYLSAGFIIEEGLSLSLLEKIVYSMATTAKEQGVSIITGDTKVVERGMADKLFINTTGVGVIPASTQISAASAQSGDKVLVNGFIGDHGATIMLARDNLGLHTDLQSDCTALYPLINHLLLQHTHDIRCIRDVTRGGLGGVLTEIAQASNITIELDELALPIRPQTQGVCELLGLDPLFLANEGLAVFIVDHEQAETVLQLMRQYPLGQHAQIIGEVTEYSINHLHLKTRYGAKRIVNVPYGLQLPRIC